METRKDCHYYEGDVVLCQETTPPKTLSQSSQRPPFEGMARSPSAAVLNESPGNCFLNESACDFRAQSCGSQVLEVLGRDVSLQAIFCAVQKEHDVSGLLTHAELAFASRCVLRVLSQTEILEAQADKLAHTCFEEAAAGLEGISFAQFEAAVLKPADMDRKATRVPRVILVSVLPVLYGVSTRIGFVTLPIHAVGSGMSLSEVGCVVGLFQIMRALANWAIVQRGSSATPPLLALAVCGFAFCSVWPHHSLSCWAYALTGLGEIIVSLQHEMMLLPCMAENPGSLKHQFAFVCLGACIAFVAGSGLYMTIGFHAPCFLGALCCLAQLVLGAYLYLSSRRRTCFSPWIHFPPDAFALRPFAVGVGSLLAISHTISHIAAPGDEQIPDTEASMCSKVDKLLDGSLGRIALDKVVMQCCVSTIMTAEVETAQWQPYQDKLELESGCLERLHRISCASMAYRHLHSHNDAADDVGVAVAQSSVPWIVHPFIFSQIFIALCIGTFLGTGGLYYTQVFGVNVFVFGVSMGFGELLGMLCSNMLPKSQQPHATHTMPLRPMTMVLWVMGAITSVILLFTAVPGLLAAYTALPAFLGAVVFQLSFQVLNDVWTYLVNDVVFRLAPISQYRRLQGQGQMYRRLGNALAGLLGPILLGVWAPLPFLVAAASLASWTLLLTVMLAVHSNGLVLNLGVHQLSSSAGVTHFSGVLSLLSSIQHLFHAIIGSERDEEGKELAGLKRSNSTSSLRRSNSSSSLENFHSVGSQLTLLELSTRSYVPLRKGWAASRLSKSQAC